MSRKSQRKSERELLAEALECDTFPWDYSYFKWQDIPREVRREMVLDRSWAARTWLYGKTTVLMDVFFASARQLYNETWDGCRDLWKAHYRARKHPESAPAVQYSQTKFMGALSGAYMTVENPPKNDGETAPRTDPLINPPAPIEPPDPKRAQYERQYREREQARRDRFNRAQQKRYEAWLKNRKAAE